MIRFCCPSCGAAASAPDDCAGRTSACRTCRKPLTVPALPDAPGWHDRPPAVQGSPTAGAPAEKTVVRTPRAAPPGYRASAGVPEPRMDAGLAAPARHPSAPPARHQPPNNAPANEALAPSNALRLGLTAACIVAAVVAVPLLFLLVGAARRSAELVAVKVATTRRATRAQSHLTGDEWTPPDLPPYRPATPREEEPSRYPPPPPKVEPPPPKVESPPIQKADPPEEPSKPDEPKKTDHPRSGTALVPKVTPDTGPQPPPIPTPHTGPTPPPAPPAPPAVDPKQKEPASGVKPTQTKVKPTTPRDGPPPDSALLEENLGLLRSPVASDRVRGVQSLGEMGAEAAPARRALCKAMLDDVQDVRKAAASALKKVDPDLGDLAFSIYINVKAEAVEKAGNLGAKPLTPLVLELARHLRDGKIGPRDIDDPTRPPLPECLVALSRMAPQEEEPNRLAGDLMVFESPRYEALWGPGSAAPVRAAAIAALRGMKDARTALRRLLLLAQADRNEAVQLEVLQSLGVLYDEKNDREVRKAVESLRLARSEAVRKAADELSQRLSEQPAPSGKAGADLRPEPPLREGNPGTEPALPASGESPHVGPVPVPQGHPPTAADEAEHYAAIDRHALSAAPANEASLDLLAEYLHRPCKTQRDKARVIYRWITDRIAYDVEGFYSGRPADCRPGAVLQRRTAVCEGYSALFLYLSRRMGLKAARVGGYAKGIAYVTGASCQGENHAWVMVDHEGGRGLIDPTWGAGNVNGRSFLKRFTEYYFLVPPDQLIFTHLPVDPRCQLLARPITREEFERQPRATPLLFRLGVSAQTVREAAAGPTGELVEVSENPFTDMRLVEAPLGKCLKEGTKYEFRFESKDCVQMAVFNDGAPGVLTNEGSQFHGTVRPRKGNLFVGGRRKEDANRFPTILRYVVE